MIRPGQFWTLCLVGYTLVVLLVGIQVGPPDWPLALCVAHALLAASLNAALLAVISRRGWSLVGGPLATALVATSTYFTFSIVKYLTTNPSYDRYFSLTIYERFAGSGIAALTIALGIGLLAVLPQPRGDRETEFLTTDRNRVGLLALTFVLATASKVALFRQGWGSAYGSPDMASVGYGWVVLFSVVSIFDYASFLLALMTGWALINSRSRSGTWLLVGVSIAGTLTWAVYTKARMPFVHMTLMGAFALQVFSWRRAVLALQGLLFALPVLGVLGATTLATMLGRENVQADSLKDVVGEIAYRADLTDLAMAFAVRMDGEAAGPAVVVDAVVAAVPRALWPNKDAYFEDAYYRHLDRHDFPPIDYLEMPYSNGFMAFGWPGLIAWPVAWWAGLAFAGAVLARLERGGTLVHYVGLVGALIMLRVEMEWVGVMLQLRDAAMFAAVVITLVLGVRAGRSALRLLGTPTRPSARRS